MPTPRSVAAAWRSRMVDHALPRALDEATEALARDVARRAPVETGHLRRSIRAVPAAREAGRIAAYVIATDQKAHLVEFGTVDQPPNPFFRRAILAWTGRARRTLLKAGH